MRAQESYQLPNIGVTQNTFYAGGGRYLIVLIAGTGGGAMALHTSSPAGAAKAR